MFFKPQLYFDCGSPFLHEDHNNDVAQNFTRCCVKNNKRIKYWKNILRLMMIGWYITIILVIVLV